MILEYRCGELGFPVVVVGARGGHGSLGPVSRHVKASTNGALSWSMQRWMQTRKKTTKGTAREDRRNPLLRLATDAPNKPENCIFLFAPPIGCTSCQRGNLDRVSVIGGCTSAFLLFAFLNNDQLNLAFWGREWSFWGFSRR